MIESLVGVLPGNTVLPAPRPLPSGVQAVPSTMFSHFFWPSTPDQLQPADGSLRSYWRTSTT